MSIVRLEWRHSDSPCSQKDMSLLFQAIRQWQLDLLQFGGLISKKCCDPARIIQKPYITWVSSECLHETLTNIFQILSPYWPNDQALIISDTTTKLMKIIGHLHTAYCIPQYHQDHTTKKHKTTTGQPKLRY